MTARTKQMIGFAATVTMIAVCTGCKCPKTLVGNERPWNPDERPPDISRINLSDPSGNGGTLTVPITQFSSGDNGQGCFPAAQGWNVYWVTFYFLGPNATATPNNYPNNNNLNSVTIDTLDTLNGTALDTGIVILDNLNPVNKVCNDDASPPFTNNPKLSKATFTPTGNLKKYRVGIHYKGPLPPGLTEIKIHWNYP